MECVQPTFSSVALDNFNFKHCFAKLTAITFNDNESTKTDISILLDELIYVDLSRVYLTEEGYNAIVRKLCHLIPFEQTLLIIKVLRALQSLIAKQQLEITAQTLHDAVAFVIRALQDCQTTVHDSALYTLATLLHEECPRLRQFHDILLGDGGLLHKLYCDNLDNEATLTNVVLCYENICIRPLDCDYMDVQYSDSCSTLFTTMLQTATLIPQYSILSSKMVASALRGLTNILSATRIFSTTTLGSILAIIRAYMTYGLTTEPCPIPDKLQPAFHIPDSNPTPPPPQSKTSDTHKPRKRKPKKATSKSVSGGHESGTTISSPFQQLSLNSAIESSMSCYSDRSRVLTSESEYSDSEGAQVNRLRTSMERVRHAALVYLQCIIKNVERRVMFGYWTSFLPTVPHTTDDTPQTIFTVILTDPADKCRLAALITLSGLVYSSKQLLVAAEYSPTPTHSFTSFSQTLGSILHELHRCLLLALVAENFPRVITQLIKCLSIVMGNAPYHRLKPGLINKVMSKVRHFINHRDINVRVACLSCFGAMCSVQPTLLEVSHILQSPVAPLSSVTTFTSERRDESADSSSSSPNIPKDSLSGCQTPTSIASTSDTSWLLKLCIKNIQPPDDQSTLEPLPVKLESLQVLTNLCKNYFPAARNHLNKLSTLIHACLHDTDPSVQLHGAKLLADKGQSMLHDEEMQQEASLPQLLEMWSAYIDGPMTQQIQAHNTQFIVKAALCDCLSMIGAQVFASLSRSKAMLCLTLCLAMVHENDPVLRASAIRTLGVYTLYPCLIQDISFLLDATSAILLGLSDCSVAVRIKAAWAMGNLSDTLVNNKDTGNSDITEEFPDTLVMHLLQAGTKGSQDNERVKYNAVRAVGNLLHYVTYTSIVNSGQSDIIRNSVYAITKCVNTGNMKVRWNACHGISCLLKNSMLLPYISKENMMTFIFDTLLVAVKDSKNFKVRIGATEAVMAAEGRVCYGNAHQFAQIWSGLIDGLTTSEEITDFAEFRYKDSLLDQVCETILHLTGLAGADDLVVLSQLTPTKWQILYDYIEKWCRSKTTKAGCELVETNLARLGSLVLDIQQGEGLRCLTNLYQIYLKQHESSGDSPEKSLFVQTYD